MSNTGPNVVATFDSTLDNNGKLNITTSTDESLRINIDASDKLNLSLKDDSKLNIDVDANESLNIDLGAIFSTTGSCKVLYNTTAYWNSRPQLIAAKGYLYVYSDWKTDTSGRKIAGIKVGDGLAYLIDMPFTDQIWADHVSDVVRHITQAERVFWNNKVRCYYNGAAEAVIFTTQ